MYIILCKKFGRDHYLTNAVCLSPAGTHFHGNWAIVAFAHFCTKIVPIFSNAVRIPDCMMIMAEKLMGDIRSLPALNDLITYLTSQLVGGPSTGK
jgi:hypothetical protein